MSNETMSPTEKTQKLKDSVQEMVNSHYRTQAEVDLRKDICDTIKEHLEILPVTFKKVAMVMYKDSANKLNADTIEVLDLVEECGGYSHEE